MTASRIQMSIIVVSIVMLTGCSSQETTHASVGDSGLRPFTLVALGDVGEDSKALRGNAFYLTNMYIGQHNGGTFDAMVFLGNNFSNTGLNVPTDDVDGRIKSILGPFKVPMTGLGRSNVHGIPGNHDYYARNSFEASFFFGLFEITEGPVGLTNKGNQRAGDIPYWSYYSHLPAQAFYPVNSGARDSVQILFFDSALLLRTDPSTWHPALDSLSGLLRATQGRPGIVWRVLAMHHPFQSLGPHGGYTEWNDETHTVEYLTQCDKDSNAVGWLKNLLDPEDLCTEKYRQYVDSVKMAIHRSGVKIQIALSGHDHSLQLLDDPNMNVDCSECPTVQIVSGAGSDQTRVKFSSPPREFTSAQTMMEKEGLSLAGFVQLRFQAERVRAVFFDVSTGEPMNMGEGRKEFWIDRQGNLIDALLPSR